MAMLGGTLSCLVETIQRSAIPKWLVEYGVGSYTIPSPDGKYSIEIKVTNGRKV